MTTETIRNRHRIAGPLTASRSELQWLEVAAEELLGNRLGSRAYGDWVDGLGLNGDERVLEIGTGAGAGAAEWARPGSFDVAVAHFVLHDMSDETRQRALDRIAVSLTPHGSLCLREPVGHGMQIEKLHIQLEAAGFELIGDERIERVPLMGETVSGVWQLWW